MGESAVRAQPGEPILPATPETPVSRPRVCCILSAMVRSRPRGWLTTLLLVAAMSGVLGHICVVPLHAHAVPVEGHGTHDEDASDHAVHTASCEAAKSRSSVAAAIVPPSRTIDLPVMPSVAPLRDRGAIDVVAAESPPLFLLHGVLLI